MEGGQIYGVISYPYQSQFCRRDYNYVALAKLTNRDLFIHLLIYFFVDLFLCLFINSFHSFHSTLTSDLDDDP
jgi:hypothetical protein